MRRCVHQQHDGPVAELLDVPAQAGGARKPAVLAVRPIAPVALPDQPVGHYRLISRRTDTGCARTACEIAAEPAAGSGQRQVGRVHLGGKPARLGLRPHGGVEIRREDFRLTRFTRRTPTTVIFAVDASGSSALHRLAETTGAVELLLAECYVRRDRVAPIAFRRQRAELLLPPTRSLARARTRMSPVFPEATPPRWRPASKPPRRIAGCRPADRRPRQCRQRRQNRTRAGRRRCAAGGASVQARLAERAADRVRRRRSDAPADVRAVPSRRRSACHGAAARSVAIKSSGLPGRSSPRAVPAGRPRNAA